MKLTGNAAIEIAEKIGATLNKYEDPTEAAREGLTVEQARKIAMEDPSLIWLKVNVAGWTGDAEGYNVHDYFRDGVYLGADEDGVEPIFEVAL